MPEAKRSRLRRLLASSQYDRALRHYVSFSLDLEALAARNPEAANGAREFLKEAGVFLDEGNIDGAWHCLNHAGRLLVDLKGSEERLNQARTLLTEAEKLSKWRKKAIETLLLDPQGTIQPTAINLKDALQLRDDYYENRYQKLAMQRGQLKILVMIAGVALAGVLLLLGIYDLESLRDWDWRLLLLIIFFALTGASFSAFRSLTAAAEAAIPDLALNSWMTLGRTGLSACLGVAVYALLRSGIINIEIKDPATVLALAFAAGFSERLVVRAVESLAGENKP